MMKTTMSTLLAAALLSGTIAVADEKQEKKETQTYSIAVETSSSSSTDGDDETKTSVSGKIVVVGADGEKKEFDLGDKLPEGFQTMKLGGSDFTVLFDTKEQEERYMIGVMCEPVSELLSTHLKIDGKGLVVTSVSDDMPASEAGIEKNDILLGIGDVPLISLDDLVKAVTDSEGKEMKLSVLKSGEKQEVMVSPKMSTGGAAFAGLTNGGGSFRFTPNAANDVQLDVEQLKNSGQNMILRRIGPGIRLQDKANFQILRSGAISGGDASGIDVIELAEDLIKDGGSDNLKKELKNLRKRLAEMEKRVESINKKAPEEE